mgnify:CR=1 FL=1
MTSTLSRHYSKAISSPTRDLIQNPTDRHFICVCQLVKGRMVKFTTTESKPRWGSTWRLVVTTSSPYQASPRAYLWLTPCASWHPDPEVGVRDEELMGLQPTQGSLQEFKLLQEVLLLEGAGVHWQEVERTTSFVCMESLASVVEEIIQRKNIVDAIAGNPWCLGSWRS